MCVREWTKKNCFENLKIIENKWNGNGYIIEVNVANANRMNAVWFPGCPPMIKNDDDKEEGK